MALLPPVEDTVLPGFDLGVFDVAAPNFDPEMVIEAFEIAAGIFDVADLTFATGDDVEAGDVAMGAFAPGAIDMGDYGTTALPDVLLGDAAMADLPGGSNTDVALIDLLMAPPTAGNVAVTVSGAPVRDESNFIVLELPITNIITFNLGAEA